MRSMYGLILSSLIVLSHSSYAQDGIQGQGFTPEQLKACKPLLDSSARDFRVDMSEFKVVWGKMSLYWTMEDYDRLLFLAQKCHGVSMDGRIIRFPEWEGVIESMRKKIGPISILNHQAMEFGKSLKTENIKLPNCIELIEYSQNSLDMTDNSKKIFGSDIVEMSDNDIQTAIEYTNQCFTVIYDLATMSKGMQKADTEKLMYSMIDKGLWVKKAREVYANEKHIPSDILMKMGDAVILPTMTTLDTRAVINRFNKATALQKRFTPETVSIIIDMIADVQKKKNLTIYDHLYLDEIKNRVNQNIFKTTSP